MLKNRAMGGEPIPSGDDRPRKKLSFRDPEVVSPPRSGYPPQSPSVRNSSQQHHISRPHSIAGVIGLGGFSAQGGVPGLPTSQISSRSSSLTRSISTTQTPASPSLPSKTSIHSSQASSQNTSRTLTRQSAHEGQTTQGKSNNPESLKPYVHNQTSQQQVKQQQSPKRPEMNNRSQQMNHQSSQRQPVRCFRRSLSHLDESLVYNGRNSDPVSSLSLEDLELENQAMRVVRTIGQAFEVCHKMAIKDKSPSPDFHADDISREGSEDSSDKPKKDRQDSESGQEDLITLPSDTYNDEQIENLPTRPSKLEPLASPKGSDILKKGETFASPLSELLSGGDYLTQAGTPLSVHHELQLLREQLEQQQQQTQAAVAQVHLLRDQLAAETAARLEAQARTHQLLVHNKDLLEHIQQLVLQVRDLEIKLHGGSGVSGSIKMPPIPPDVKSEKLGV